MAVSFIGGGNQRIPPTCRKTLKNRPVQPIAVELNVIENIGDTIYEEINSNGHLPEVEETDFPSEASFPDDIESKYEDIDDLRTDKHEYL